MNTAIEITNSLLHVQIEVTPPPPYPDPSFSNVQYAYYLHKDDAVAEKKWYSESREAGWKLTENGIYYVTTFVKDMETGKIKTFTSDKLRYIKGRNPEYLPFYQLEEMEMTNCCNLSCQNCCTPTSRYPRGFIDDGTVLAALSWTQAGQTLNYHRQGEPLLHKNLEKYIGWGVQAGIKPVISTNGILLTGERLEELYRQGLRHLVFTLHTMDSLKSFCDAYAYLKKQNENLFHFNKRAASGLPSGSMFFAGKVLDFSDDVEQSRDVRQAISQLPEEVKAFLAHTPVHTWAGNVENTRQNFQEDVVAARQKQCYFIQRHVVNMRWDGTIVGCCFDSENDNVLGHIRDFASLRPDIEKYRLCEHCDSNWAVGL
ncbi:radical SAM protein [Anaerotruncus sp.]|uniref:radical SAM protein n=1 Tax=Anaerotruncus sp. TaxID=1872531 RepID=UPI0021710A0B|nr:radical SAM protein [Anaerotruncus sp.]MCI8491946.1 radical SAM protein [Anaerotruncus sp.]